MGIRDWVHRLVGNDSDALLVVDDEAEEPVAYSAGYLVIRNTGDAVGENAVTGYSGPAPKRGQRIVVQDTGNATASDGGYANSGIDYGTDKKGKR